MILSALLSLGVPAACLIVLSRPRVLHYVHRRFRHSHRLLAVMRTAHLTVIVLTAVAVLTDQPGFAGAAVAVLLLVLALQPGLLFLLIPQTRSPAPQSILVVAAHPDDLEIAVGGTLAKFIDNGHRVHALVMSHGDAGGDAAVRPHEAKAGAWFLGLTSLTLLDLPDRRLELSGTEMIDAIESHVGDLDPHVILTHSGKDVHQDHHAVHMAVLRAARHHSSILCFESPSVMADFDPRVFMEIGDYRHVKTAGIAAHADQSAKGYMADDVIGGIASFRGRQSRLGRAEGFEVIRLQLGDVLPL